MGWKWPLILLSVLGLLGLAGWGVSLRLDAILDEHRRECVQILEEFPADPRPRPAILEPAEPGNVWDCYRPAFATLKSLDPDKDWGLSKQMAPLMEILEVPAKPPAWLVAAKPSLDQCRRGARRSDLGWQGPIDPGLEAAAFRAVKALCSRAYLSWQAGKDADAAEDLVAALTLTSDVGRLGGRGLFLQLAEPHILDHFSKLLSLQGLSAAQLEKLEQQVDRLRSARLVVGYGFRHQSALVRLEVLDGDITEMSEQSNTPVPLSERLDWRDLYSLRFAKVRMVRSIRTCGRDCESVAWTRGAAPSAELQRILDRHQGRHVRDLVARYWWVAAMEEAKLLNLELLSLALRCARVQAVQGRLPASAAETELTLPFVSHVKFFPDRFFLDTSGLGLMYGNSDIDQNWPMRRRP